MKNSDIKFVQQYIMCSNHHCKMTAEALQEKNRKKKQETKKITISLMRE